MLEKTMTYQSIYDKYGEFSFKARVTEYKLFGVLLYKITEQD